jgi:hypothetical protein
VDVDRFTGFGMSSEGVHLVMRQKWTKKLWAMARRVFLALPLIWVVVGKNYCVMDIFLPETIE